MIEPASPRLRSSTAHLHGVERAAAPRDPLATLQEVSQRLATDDSMHRRIEGVLRVLEDCIGARRSMVCTGLRGCRELIVEASHGRPASHFRPVLGRGVTGRVAHSDRPIVVPVVSHDPMALCELTNPDEWHCPAFSLVSVPLTHMGDRTGALSVYFVRDDDEFTTHVKTVQVVASQFAQALRRADIEGSARRGKQSSAPPAPHGYSNMVGDSSAMRQIYEQIGQVARTTATTLVRGESGTGKELVAQAIHEGSPRSDNPFMKINCAALPETLFESELFGHERGAFTGAHARKIGRFEAAAGGTILLDEVGEMPVSTQVKLLRVLQQREFERLGGTETLNADVRLVAATNRDLEQAVREGTFREDLYYRLNVFSITVPPLRERPSDIVALAEHFLTKYAGAHRRQAGRIANSTLDILCRHTWPGNVRELENAIERAVVVCDDFVVGPRHLPESVQGGVCGETEKQLSLSEAVERLERRLIEDALRESRGRIARAADALGTTERIIRYKVGKYGISTKAFRQQT